LYELLKPATPLLCKIAVTSWSSFASIYVNVSTTSEISFLGWDHSIEKASSLAGFGCVIALCDLPMCLPVRWVRCLALLLDYIRSMNCHIVLLHKLLFFALCLLSLKFAFSWDK